MTAVELTEAAWQRQVLELAELGGWLAYHTHDSRRSHPGWPDLVLCRPPEFVVVELKRERGRLRPEQVVWLDALTACGVETAVWRPSDFEAARDRLLRRAG